MLLVPVLHMVLSICGLGIKHAAKLVLPVQSIHMDVGSASLFGSIGGGDMDAFGTTNDNRVQRSKTH